MLLPSLIDYERRRLAYQDRYLQVTRPPLRVFDKTDDITDRKQLPDAFLVDPMDGRTFSGRSLPRGLHFWPVRGPSAPA